MEFGSFVLGSELFSSLTLVTDFNAMTFILIAILLLALLVGVAATTIAIARPRVRGIAAIAAGLGFIGAGACVGVFIWVVNQMN